MDMYRITVGDKHIDVSAMQFRWLASLLESRMIGSNLDDTGISIEPIVTVKHVDADYMAEEEV